MADNYVDLPLTAAVSWKASVTNSASLPSTGNTTGDARVARDTGAIYVWTGAAWVNSSGSSGVTAVGALDSQAPSAAGLVISGTSIFAQSASATSPGLVNNTTQTFSGDKTFTGTINLSALSASLPLQLDASKNIISALITNAGMATMATGTVKGNISGSTAAPSDIPATSSPGVANSVVLRNDDGLISDFDPSFQVYQYNDFIGGGSPPADLTVNNTGANSKSSIRAAASDNAHPGVWSLQTGTTTSGNGNLFGSNVDQVFTPVGAGAFVWGALVQVPVLSDGTDRFTVLAGMSDDPYNANVTPSFGIYFSYVDNATSGRWTFYCVSGANTTVDTGITVVAGSWYKLRFVINAAGTSVQAYVDGVAVGSPITTNIPTAKLMIAFINKKSLGTTNREFYIDYYKVVKTLTTPR